MPVQIEIVQLAPELILTKNKPNLMTKNYYHFEEGLTCSLLTKTTEKFVFNNPA